MLDTTRVQTMVAASVFTIIMILGSNHSVANGQQPSSVSGSGFQPDIMKVPRCSAGPMTEVKFAVDQNTKQGSFSVVVGGNSDGGKASLISLQQGQYQILGTFGAGACGDQFLGILLSGDCGSNVNIVGSVAGQKGLFWMGTVTCPNSIAIIDGSIVGTSKNDVISDKSGVNCIDSRAGNDVVVGQSGPDKIISGDGNDILTGGNGDDELTGGNGVDKFDCGTGKDKIIDFSQSDGDIKSSNCE